MSRERQKKLPLPALGTDAPATPSSLRSLHAGQERALSEHKRAPGLLPGQEWLVSERPLLATCAACPEMENQALQERGSCQSEPAHYCHANTNHQDYFRPWKIILGTNYMKSPNQSGNHNMLTTNQVFFPPPPSGQQAFPVHIRRKVAPLKHQNYTGCLASRDFRTVHKEAYDGWDPSNYQQPKPVHLQDELTNMVRNSNAKFDDSTVTKVSYPPPFKTIKVETGKQPTSIFRFPKAKFQDVTTNKQFFQNWGAKPPNTHGDIYDGTYLKPTLPFKSQTNSKNIFMPTIVKKAKLFKPQSSSLKIEGKYDFSTVYREAYRSLQLPSCPPHTRLIQNQDTETTNTETTTQLT
ncbi:uncharacterized protein LOC141507098 [Macrotis lagotis]|uniref:uncharacterized protein LOC141507098 n=1 Tax=Macrotis lagotis TaxID=92651 RepID=UPI003D69796A